MKRLIPITLILIVALAACSVLPSSTPTPIPTLSLAPASPGNSATSQGVTASAQVMPLSQTQLSFPAIGRVKTVDVKVGDKVTVGQSLLTLDTTLLEARVREAEANLRAAQIQVDYLKRVGTDERYMESALADVDRAQALLDSARTTLEMQSALLAPMPGTVITVDAAPGETLVPGYTAITIADLSKFHIETTDLSERNITRIKVGQAVKISIEALGEEFTGKVSEIALLSSTLGGDVVYTVSIEFDKQPQGLMWGMSADVEIQTE